MRRTFIGARFKLKDVWQWFSSQRETKQLFQYKEQEKERRREMVLSYKSRRVQSKVKRRIQFFPSVKVKVFKEDEFGLVNSSMLVPLSQ